MIRRTAVGLLVTVAWIAGPSAIAQLSSKSDFVPHVGQPGKDVVWVPTPEAVVDRMLSMTKVTPNDFVVDLGSGDGRTVIAAAKKFGARAQGIEFNPDMVALANRNAQAAGLGGKVKFIHGDIFALDWADASVVTMYLLPELNLRLRPRLLEMRPGTRLASHQFSMSDWDADERVEVGGRLAFMWIVPARVGGLWTLSHSAGNGTASHDVTISQSFQKISGVAQQGGYSTALEDARLRGADIVFSFVDRTGVRRRYVGRVSDDKMEGALDSGKVAEMRWIAKRKNGSAG